MKHILAIAVLMFLGTGLFAQATAPKKTFYFQKKSQIASAAPDTQIEEPKITAGKNLVFYYEWQSAKNPMIADADRTDRVYFELTQRQANNYHVKGQEITKSKLVHCRMCFCLKGGCWTAIEGELEVKKVGKNKYKVSFRTNEEAGNLLIDETFTLK